MPSVCSTSTTIDSIISAIEAKISSCEATGVPMPSNTTTRCGDGTGLLNELYLAVQYMLDEEMLDENSMYPMPPAPSDVECPRKNTYLLPLLQAITNMSCGACPQEGAVYPYDGQFFRFGEGEALPQLSFQYRRATGLEVYFYNAFNTPTGWTSAASWGFTALSVTGLTSSDTFAWWNPSLPTMPEYPATSLWNHYWKVVMTNDDCVRDSATHFYQVGTDPPPAPPSGPCEKGTRKSIASWTVINGGPTQNLAVYRNSGGNYSAWILIETTRNLIYGSGSIVGGVLQSLPSLWTPPVYEYPGTMQLQVIC